jgi:hypothetical protein
MPSLHLGNGIFRATQHCLQLVPVILRRVQRIGQRAFHAKRTQLAAHHGLNAGGCFMDAVAGAVEMSVLMVASSVWSRITIQWYRLRDALAPRRSPPDLPAMY